MAQNLFAKIGNAMVPVHRPHEQRVAQARGTARPPARFPLFLAALVAGHSLDKAAAGARIRPTMARHLYQDPRLQKLIQQVRAEAFDNGIGMLIKTMPKQIENLISLSRNAESEKVRLAAASRLLELVILYRPVIKPQITHNQSARTIINQSNISTNNNIDLSNLSQEDLRKAILARVIGHREVKAEAKEIPHQPQNASKTRDVAPGSTKTLHEVSGSHPEPERPSTDPR